MLSGLEPRERRSASRSGKPTLRTIAEMAGLATTTISRALNNAPELSHETRERVQKLAAEVGYVPDRTALRLKTGRTNVIGLVLNPHEEILNFGQSLVGGISAALSGSTYHLVIMPARRDASPIDQIRYILSNRMADGVIFSRTSPHDERVRLLIDAGFPFVSHGRTDFPGHAYVDYDNAEFAYTGVRRLHAKGRRKLSVILPQEGYTFTRYLREGIARAVAETGMNVEFVAGTNIEDGADAIRAATMTRIAQGAPPDAYLCAGDSVALAVMAGITDAGQTIGTDVDVVTKQMSGIFSLVRPRVDVVNEDITLAGLQMAQLLLRQIQGEPAETLQILQAPELLF
jgi:LacI family transcriptional regulator